MGVTLQTVSDMFQRLPSTWHSRIVLRRLFKPMESVRCTMELDHLRWVLLCTVVPNSVFKISLRHSTLTKKILLLLVLLVNLPSLKLLYHYPELSPTQWTRCNVVFKLMPPNLLLNNCTQACLTVSRRSSRTKGRVDSSKEHLPMSFVELVPPLYWSFT